VTSHPEAVFDPSRDLLFRLASRFRAAIVRENLSAKNNLTSLQAFPRGACSDASLLLAKYLQVKGCGMSQYVLGKRRCQAHAWLQLEEYTIDITADQFHDQDAAVIVSKASSWHRPFNGKIQNVADFCLYDRNTVFRLTRAYHSILDALP
jgi:hypothetical protein